MSNLCLVTGGGGFLGRYIVEQLLANGRQVRIFSRGAYPQLQAANVDVVQGDLRDPLAVQNACRDALRIPSPTARPDQNTG